VDRLPCHCNDLVVVNGSVNCSSKHTVQGALFMLGPSYGAHPPCCSPSPPSSSMSSSSGLGEGKRLDDLVVIVRTLVRSTGTSSTSGSSSASSSSSLVVELAVFALIHVILVWTVFVLRSATLRTLGTTAETAARSLRGSGVLNSLCSSSSLSC
jgi:hypothetical protein